MTSATTTDSVTSDLAKLPDTGLAYLARQLEAKIATLKFSTTAIGARLLEQYQERLDARWVCRPRRAIGARSAVGQPFGTRHTSPGCFAQAGGADAGKGGFGFPGASQYHFSCGGCPFSV
jgi:hypothetical protein